MKSNLSHWHREQMREQFCVVVLSLKHSSVAAFLPLFLLLGERLGLRHMKYWEKRIQKLWDDRSCFLTRIFCRCANCNAHDWALPQIQKSEETQRVETLLIFVCLIGIFSESVFAFVLSESSKLQYSHWESGLGVFNWYLGWILFENVFERTSFLPSWLSP